MAEGVQEGKMALGFLDLVEDIHLLLATSFLDLPTLLSLSFSSSSLHARYTKFLPKDYTNWMFLDACVALDYGSLLEYAIESGSRTDHNLLEKAVEGGKVNAAKVLFPLQITYFTEDRSRRYNIFLAACGSGKRELVDLLAIGKLEKHLAHEPLNPKAM